MAGRLSDARGPRGIRHSLPSLLRTAICPPGRCSRCAGSAGGRRAAWGLCPRASPPRRRRRPRDPRRHQRGRPVQEAEARRGSPSPATRRGCSQALFGYPNHGRAARRPRTGPRRRPGSATGAGPGPSRPGPLHRPGLPDHHDHHQRGRASTGARDSRPEARRGSAASQAQRVPALQSHCRKRCARNDLWPSLQGTRAALCHRSRRRTGRLRWRGSHNSINQYFTASLGLESRDWRIREADPYPHRKEEQ